MLLEATPHSECRRLLTNASARVSGATGEHHEHENTFNHPYHTAGSGRRRLLWPGTLVLSVGVHRTQTRVTDFGEAVHEVWMVEPRKSDAGCITGIGSGALVARRS